MIENNINNLLCELSKYHRSKSDIIYDCINNRLNKSLESYNSELNDSFEYLARRKPEKIMRKLNR